MKKKMWMIPLVLLVGVLVLSACSTAADTQTSTQTGAAASQGAGYSTGTGRGSAQTAGAQGAAGQNTAGGGYNAAGTASGSALIPVSGSASLDDLTREEIDGILLMREEEKLAHDVYLALYDQWGLNVFSNIASSEAMHMDAVGTLLERFGIEDPINDTAAGVFTNQELQALYDELTAQGSQSLEAALRVGAAIEEIVILDLQDLLALSSDAEILRVYGSLLSGSENHLRSFVRLLEQQTGEVYKPGYLSIEAYQAILDGAFQGGGGNGQRGGNGHG